MLINTINRQDTKTARLILMDAYQGALFDDSFFGHCDLCRFFGVVIVFILIRPCSLTIFGLSGVGYAFY